MMVRFNCDYAEGAHEEILKLMLETNMEQTPGYGADPYSEQARDIIRELCRNQEAEVQFLVGGTQTNLTVISSALRPHQCVIAPETGHINVHETGAIEACGHKVWSIPTEDGKLTAKQIWDAWESHAVNESYEHMVQPKMVYISNPTEIGTIYSRQELEEISRTCRECGLYLFMDGARLAYALTAKENDLDLEKIAQCCDVFYIGGTKVGALFGEAVVITNDTLKEDFRYIMKQKGAMLAKGRLLGIQFIGLLKNDLYFQMGDHANKMAMKLKAAFQEAGCTFLIDSPTNQQFPILADWILKELGENYSYSYQERIDEEHSAVRFCTSWATKEEDVDSLIQDFQRILGKNRCV